MQTILKKRRKQVRKVVSTATAAVENLLVATSKIILKKRRKQARRAVSIATAADISPKVEGGAKAPLLWEKINDLLSLHLANR